MNRYTGTAKRVIAAISCAAMVLSNLGSDLQTITAYADETTEQSSTPTGQNQTGDGDVMAVDDAEPVVYDADKENESTNGASTDEEDDASSEASSEPGDDASSEASSEHSDDASSEASSEHSDDASSEASSEHSDDASSEASSEHSDDVSSEASSEQGDDASSEASSEQSDDASSEASTVEKDEEPGEPTEIDETANVYISAKFVEKVTDEESGETSYHTIHNSKALHVDGGEALVLRDAAIEIEDYEFIRAEIDGDEVQEIAIETETDEDENTVTTYYVIDGDRLDVDPDTESVNVTVNYIYEPTKAEEEETVYTTRLETSIAGGRVTAEMSEDANIPEDAELHADLITGEAHDTAVELAKEAVLENLDGEEEDYTFTAVIYDIYFTIVNEDGETERIEPNDNVSIRMEFNRARNIGTDDDAEVVETAIVHISGTEDPEAIYDEDARENLNAEILSTGSGVETDDKNNIEAIEFENDRFSYNMVLMAVANEVETLSRSMTIKWADADNAYQTRNASTFLANGTLKGGANDITISLTDETAAGYCKVHYFDGEGKEVTDAASAATWVLTFPNLPKENAGKTIDYYIEPWATTAPYDAKNSKVDTDLVSDAGYTETVTNVSSHQDVTNRLYLGETTYTTDTTTGQATKTVAANQAGSGTARLTLTGKTHYEATKWWIDDGDTSARPDPTMTLYRYPDGEDYTTATAVGTEYGVSTTVTAPNTDGDVKMGQKDSKDVLAAFNQDGKLYNYIARETGAGSYETKYWDEKAGRYTDVPGNYVDNGETFYNVNTETTSQTFQKTFAAKSIQDAKYDVEILLWQTTDKSVAEAKDTTKATPATDANGDQKTVDLKGFSEKNTTSEDSFDDLPKYNTTDAPYTTDTQGNKVKNDKAGQALYYFVTEGTVTKTKSDGTTVTGITETVDGVPYIIIDGYRYRQTYSESKGKDSDGNDIKIQEITNALVADTEISINKTFPDGFSEDGSVQNETITYQVFRDGEPIGYYKYDYTLNGLDKDGNATTPRITSYGQLYTDEACTTPSTQTGNLERYKADGSQYVYAVKEVGNSSDTEYNVTSSASSNDDTHTVTYQDGTKGSEHYLLFNQNITNHIPNTTGTTISVNKVWKDDSQQLYRGTISVAIQMKLTSDDEWQTVATDKITYEESMKDIEILDPTVASVFHNSNLSISKLVDAWRHAGYPTTPQGTLNADDTYTGAPAIRVIETSFQSKAENGSGISYVWNKGGNGVDLQGNALTNPTKKPVGIEHKSDVDALLDTSDQNFDITYEYTPSSSTHDEDANEGYVSMNIVNTRVGTVSATFTKTWNDDNNELSHRPDKIELTIQATVESYTTDNNGNLSKASVTTPVWYTTSGTQLNPATGEAGGGSYAGEAPAGGAGKSSLRVYTLTAAANGNGNGNTWTLDGTGDLRKYDADGKVITYTIIEEKMYKNGELVSSSENHYVLNRADGQIGATWTNVPQNHTGDTGVYNLENSLTQTVQIEVNKIWRDAGQAASSRPDIYPVLYRAIITSSANATGSVTVNGNTVYYKGLGEYPEYVSYSMHQNTEQDNWWTISYPNLPRYSEAGEEYIYFVGEATHVEDHDYVCDGAFATTPDENAISTDVNGVTLNTYNPNKGTAYAQIDGKNLIPITQASYDAGSQVTTFTTGTFVNRADKQRNVDGEKTWSTGSYSLPNAQKLSLKVTLYRLRYDVAQAYLKKAANWNNVFKDTTTTVGYNGTTKTIDKWLEQVTASDYEDVAFGNAEQTLSTSDGWKYSWKGVKKYDENGKPYTYLVKEVVVSDTGVNDNLQDYYDYSIDSDGNVTNKFKADQGYQITFTKDWDVKNLDKDSIGSVPIVNIRLVRYLQDANGNPIGDGETAATTTIEFKNYPGTNGVAEDATEATQQDKVEWKNLPYYGTNGRPYIYKVEETSKESLGGMKVSTTQPGATIVEDKNNRQTLTKVTVNVVDNYKGIDTNDKTGQTELKNEYGSVRGVIKVRKQWIKSTTDDNDLPNLPISTGENKDHLAVRVDRLQYLKNSLIANGQNTAADTDYKVDIEHEITFDLYRNTNSFESSKAESLNTILHLTGDGATNADTLSANNSWTTKIDNLEIYDGAGVQYWYYVKERSGGSFKVGTYYDEYSGFAGADEDEAKAGTAILVNVPKTETVTARKVWNTQDYANGEWKGDINTNPDLAKLDVLGALPDSITYTVQYRIDNSGEWSTLYKDTAKTTPVTITGTITHATKNAAGEITKAGDYNYKAEYKDLPSYVFTQSGNTITAHEVQYRAIETAMTLSDGSTKKVAISDRDESGLLNTDKNGSFDIGAMKASDKVEAAGTNWDGTHYANLTTTTNVIPVRTLKIRKIWDDELNRDGKRPTELTITVTNGSKSATTVIDTAVTEALPTVTSSTDNWDDGGAYANYYMNKLGDRPIAQSAVWETSIEVPAGNSIQVTEPAVPNYTSSAFAPDDTSWSDEQTTGVSKTIASDVTDYTVTFANKMWISNQVVIDKTLEEDLAPENLRSQTIRYQLQYKVGENGAWQMVPNDWMTKATVTNGTYDTVAQEIAVTRSNGTYPTVTVKNLPKYDENGWLYRYRVEETDPGSGYGPQYDVDGKQQSDGSFKSEITNRYYTVNATIDKTWHDDFGLNADVQTTVYQLQRREISVANTDSNSPLGAALNFLGLDGDVTVPEPTAWTAVTRDDIPGADFSAATMKSDEKSLVQVVLTVSEDELNTTAKIANLIGIKAVEDDYKTYYEYRYVENGMIMQGNDAGKTTEATEHDSAKSNEALAAENGGGTDGGYRLAYTFSDNYGNTFEPDKTFATHVDAYIQTASIVVHKVWNDKDNYDGIRPNSLSVSLTMNVTHDSAAGSVDYTNSKVAQSGTLVKSESYANKTTWATVPVSDAYGDKFTYTFDEKCPGGYQKTGYPEPFTTKDGKTYKVSFCNFHYVPDVTPDGGGEDSGEDDPTPVTPTPVPVTPVPEETPTDDTTTEEPADTTERGEHYGDPAYGYFDELGNWHYFDEEGNTSANGETGDDSLMTVYAGAAAASAAVLAAWFVLYRRKREQ